MADTKTVDRRGFLKGSALFAAAVAAAAVPAIAHAQEPARQPDQSGKDKPAEPPKTDAPAEKKLFDENGREYRVCERCGSNMYLQEKVWTCESCGLSYVD